MKIYLLNLDAVPWGDDLAAFAAARGLRRLTTVNAGTYTHTSVLSRLTGRGPSELVTGGIGPRAAQLPRYHRWMGPDTPSLIGRLPAAGWNVELRNCTLDSWLSFLARGVAPPGIRAGSWRARIDWLESQWPGVTITSAADDPAIADFDAFHDPAACDAFYARERAYVLALQRRSGPNQFVFATLSHWHQVRYYQPHAGLDAARRATMAWLDAWDWEERDAIFWLFCDHGHECTVEAPPPDYLTWTLVRDNTGASRSWAPLHASQDFYALACEVAGLDAGPAARRPHDPPARDRVYVVEDARKALSTYESVTAAAVKVVDWSPAGEPESLVQLTWLRHLGRWVAFRAPVSDPAHYERRPADFREPLMRELRDALRERVTWLRTDPAPWVPLGRMRAWRLRWREWADDRAAGGVRLD